MSNVYSKTHANILKLDEKEVNDGTHGYKNLLLFRLNKIKN